MSNAPEQVIVVDNPQAQLRGWLVIDALVNDSSTGGIRMLPDVNPQELSHLARTMTAKHLFLGIPKGGGRAGIVTPENATEQNKQQLLNAFATHPDIRTLILEKRWLPAPDMGCASEMIRKMHVSVGSTMSKTSKISKHSSYYTALSVFESIRRLLEEKQMPLEGARCLVEGFGNVGGNLATLLHGAGAQVIAISTIDGALVSNEGLNIPKLLSLRDGGKASWMTDYNGADHVGADELLMLPADVLAPCGRSYQINEQNVNDIQVSVIAAGANNPVTENIEDRLHSRGIIYLPDFITNSGGVLGNNMEFLGLSKRHIQRMIREVLGEKISYVLKLSKETQQSSSQIAHRIIEEKKVGVGKAVEKKNPLFRMALSAFRSGALPVMFVRPVAYKYIERQLVKDTHLYHAYTRT